MTTFYARYSYYNIVRANFKLKNKTSKNNLD